MFLWRRKNSKKKKKSRTMFNLPDTNYFFPILKLICQTTCLMRIFQKTINQNYIIIFKNFFTLIKNRFVVFYMMNTRTREEIGPRERRGVSVSLIVFITKKKVKSMRLKKIVRTLSARNQRGKKIKVCLKLSM